MPNPMVRHDICNDRAAHKFDRVSSIKNYVGKFYASIPISNILGTIKIFANRKLNCYCCLRIESPCKTFCLSTIKIQHYIYIYIYIEGNRCDRLPSDLWCNVVMILEFHAPAYRHISIGKAWFDFYKTHGILKL